MRAGSGRPRRAPTKAGGGSTSRRDEIEYHARVLLQNGSRARHDDLFGGQGAVHVKHLVGAVDIPPFSDVLECELDPGGAVGAHRQQRDPELVIGLEGEGEVVVEGRPLPLSRGCVAYLALGQQLEIKNLSSQRPFRYLIIKARMS